MESVGEMQAEEDRARRIAELRREIAEEEREIRRIYRLRSETRDERDAVIRSYRRRIRDLASARDTAFTRIVALVRERDRTPRRLEERRHELAEKIATLAAQWREARESIPALRGWITRTWREAEAELARLRRSLRWHRGYLDRLKEELEKLLGVKWCEFLASCYVKYLERPKVYRFRQKKWARRFREQRKGGEGEERVLEARGLFVSRFEEYGAALEAACDNILLPWLLEFVESVIGWPADTVETGRAGEARDLELTNGGRILVEEWKTLVVDEEEENEYDSDQEIYDVQYERIVRDPAAQRTITLKGLWWHKARQALMEEFLK
jgi:hypothetical protein